MFLLRQHEKLSVKTFWQLSTLRYFWTPLVLWLTSRRSTWNTWFQVTTPRGSFFLLASVRCNKALYTIYIYPMTLELRFLPSANLASSFFFSHKVSHSFAPHFWQVHGFICTLCFAYNRVCVWLLYYAKYMRRVILRWPLKWLTIGAVKIVDKRFDTAGSHWVSDFVALWIIWIHILKQTNSIKK